MHWLCCCHVLGPVMMPAEGMGGHPDAKQRVELSKESVGSAPEQAKAKVSPVSRSHSGCLLLSLLFSICFSPSML